MGFQARQISSSSASAGTGGDEDDELEGDLELAEASVRAMDSARAAVLAHTPEVCITDFKTKPIGTEGLTMKHTGTDCDAIWSSASGIVGTVFAMGRIGQKSARYDLSTHGGADHCATAARAWAHRMHFLNFGIVESRSARQAFWRAR